MSADATDARWLRYAFLLARDPLTRGGDQPFAALLVGPGDELLLDAVNDRSADLVGHAETTVMRQAIARWPRDFIGACTLYSSTEPCLMCAGAIAWAGPATLVYGLSQERLNSLPWATPPRFRSPLPARTLFAGMYSPIAVRGPLLEEEALAVQVDFWNLDLRAY